MGTVEGMSLCYVQGVGKKGKRFRENYLVHTMATTVLHVNLEYLWSYYNGRLF
jgi:hypothetical protein